ncbi:MULTISPECIES: hypothetical protein [Bradyrhizobium]|uniref:hypothetical protein n=1 Tax=Bradyrhizobium TaxID=374 RepID=UPI001B8A3961|nr:MULTISPECIES: hypothetical protein [Bradyrhizobium]MBR0970756.1 hypothetical protein [Bradyrhizobium japonicum]
MPDPELIKRWKTTETLLERARRALPETIPQHEQERVALMAQYQAFLDHNELELALDILEQLGHLTSAKGGFWRDLERAAENMALAERLHALRKAFADTPVKPQG